MYKTQSNTIGACSYTQLRYHDTKRPIAVGLFANEPCAERLAVGEAVFGSSRRSQKSEGQLVTFDRHDELKKLIPQLNDIGREAGFEPIPHFHLAPHMFRRTMAVITAQQPDGEVALGIQLKHAARRAVANGTTSGYASETPEWAAEFEHELQEAVASRLVGMWSSDSVDDIKLAGAGAQRFRDELVNAPPRSTSQ